jgi:DNA-binding transcriptional ArsR family regulator
VEFMENKSLGESLLQNLLSSDGKAQLLVLFRKNPGLIDEVEGIARRVGKKKEAVETDLKDLVEAGVVKEGRVGRVPIFSLDRKKDEEVQRAVGSYLMGIKGLTKSQ